MAQDAELKLKVSLDLAFFRQQISTISTQLAGQGIDISAKIDDDDVIKQYKSLAKTLESKTIKLKVESATLDSLVTKAANLKKSLEEFGGKKISLGVEIADNIDELRKNIKSKLPAIKIGTSLEEPVNVDDFIRDVAKKVKDQTERSYVAGGIPIATKLALPGITEPLNALQKNLNRQDPLKAKVGTRPSIFKADVTAFQAAVNEKFKNISVKVRAELDTASAATTQTPAAGSSRTFLQELKGLDKGVLQSIYRAAGEDALLAFDEGITNNKASMIQALRDAAKDASDGFLAALENKKSALFKAAGEYAGALLGGLKKELKIQSPSREMFDIGDDAGKGFELGLLKAMQLAEKSATNQMRRMLDRLARMALMMGGMSAEQINRQVAQARALPGLNFPATVPPRQRVPIGPSETGRALPAGRAAAGLIGAAQGPAGLLPSATRQSSLTTGLEALIQALASQSRGRGPEGPGAIVSMETGFIPAMRERFAKVAERYLFGVETQVMDLFDAALRQVESAVDLHIARIQGQISQRMRSAFSVVDLGVQGRPMLPGAITGRAPLMLPPTGGTTPLGQMRFNAVSTGQFEPPTPLMLPPAGGTTPPSQMRFNAVKTGRFPSDGMHIPSTELPSTYLKGRELVNVLKESEKYLQQTKVPLAGAIQGLGAEFGFALQQVLLFGTAYKALAFITNLPGEALSAATSLQTFRNQLEAVTGGAAQAEEAFSFVSNIASQLNVPLDSAREGFVRLYASMSPAGIADADIENLFVGISKAAATFGMGTDEVNRMTNAFAQMASKGSLSAEEVKNQLGDVMPGALALFARAAQMDIGTFLEAMEDGQFKAEAMGQVLRNVGKLMNTDFGGAAAGAADTLQGSLNGLRNSVKTMYESFEPLVTMIGSAVFPQLSGLINDATGAIQAFAAGMQGAADPSDQLSSNGKAIYDALLQVAEIGKSLQGIIGNLSPTFLNLGKGLLTVVEYVVRFMNTGLGGWLTKTAVQVGVLTAALQLLSSAGIGAAIRGVILLITNFTAAIAKMREMITASKLLRLALFSVVGVVILQGLEMLVERMNSVSDSIRDISAEARQAKKDLDAMAAAGQLAEVQGRKQLLEEELQSIEKAQGILQKMRQARSQGRALPISQQEFETLQRTGLASGIDYRGGVARAGRGQIEANLEAAQRGRIASLNKLGAADEAEAEASRQAIMASERNQRLEKVTLDAGEGKTKTGRALSVDELLGGQIKRDLDKRRKDLEEALQKELNRVAGFENAEQATRMVEYAAKLLDIKYQINAIDETILGREKIRDKFIASQRDKASAALAFDEQTNDLKAARVNLEKDIAIALLKQKGEAEKQARQERDEIERIRKQQAEKIAENIKGLQDEIALLRAINKEEQDRLRTAQENQGATQEQLSRIYDLKKVRDNIAATREIIDSFVIDTSSDYKGFLKEVISGEDAVDSLKKFQEALKDRTLTIFLDFAMAPVEKFFKEGLSKFAIENFFPKGAAENMPEETKPSTTPVEAQDKNTAETKLNTEAIKANTAAMTGVGGAAPSPGQATAAGGTFGIQTLPFNGQTGGMLQTLPFNGQTGGMLQNLPFSTGDTGFLSAIGINSEELSASISESANAYSEQLGKVDASVFESANALGTAGTELSKEGAAGKKWHESLGQAVGGLGMAAGAVMGIVAGINQIKEGGTSNVLGGIGMIASMAGSLLGSFGGLFGGGAGPSSIVQGKDVPIAQMPAGMQFASGGIAPGGFQAFANGGVVSGPTLGLVGEGKYNEAVVPLPNGRSIPVQFSGERSARDMMSRNAQAAAQASPINLSFETTKIGNTEYVSRDQLEAAMAETRRAAINGGAARGMSMTLDRIQQSPSVRSRIGIR